MATSRPHKRLSCRESENANFDGLFSSKIPHFFLHLPSPSTRLLRSAPPPHDSHHLTFLQIRHLARPQPHTSPPKPTANDSRGVFFFSGRMSEVPHAIWNFDNHLFSQTHRLECPYRPPKLFSTFTSIRLRNSRWTHPRTTAQEVEQIIGKFDSKKKKKCPVSAQGVGARHTD